MSKNKPLVFVGTIKKVPNCGESMKNHLFIERFREVYDKVITVDVFAPKKHKKRNTTLYTTSYTFLLLNK